MIINYNSMASNALRQLNANQANQAKSMAKLSSGLRINSAADDAAGLTISESMKGQIRGLNQASRNAQDGISMTQTAEGALGQTTNILQRMRELAVQGSNATNTTTDRANIQKEMDQLTSQINGIGNTTEFNSQNLLDGSKDASSAQSATIDTQIGANSFKIDAGSTAGIAANGLKIQFTTGTVAGGGAATASFDSSGTLTVTLSASSASITASDIQNAIQSVGSGAANEPTGLDLSGLTVSADSTANSTINATLGVNNSTVLTGAKNAGTGTGVQLQIGANQNQSMTLEFSDMRASALGLTGTSQFYTTASAAGVTDGTSNTPTERGLDVSTSDNASHAITIIDNAINQVSTERAKMGAYENRLNYTNDNLTTSSQNISDAQSRIANVDMASEMMNQSQASVLSQAAESMLAQANQQPQMVLKLLG